MSPTTVPQICTVSETCVVGLEDCLRDHCTHWDGTCCTWTRPPAQERPSRGAKLMLGKIRR